MTNAAHSSRRLSGLALLCACAIMLTWIAPAIAAVTVDSLEFLKLSQDHHVSDVAAEQAETSDASDDPVWLFSSSRAHLQPLTSSLCFTHLTKRTWTPAPPVRPPIVHA